MFVSEKNEKIMATKKKKERAFSIKIHRTLRFRRMCAGFDWFRNHLVDQNLTASCATKILSVRLFFDLQTIIKSDLV
jgi:hypothetical protein